MASTRKIIFLWACLIIHTTLFAQTPNLNEIFRQKKTQRKYFAQQAIALQAYLEVLKKGYQIADKGLTLIGNLSGDEQGDHLNRLAILKGSNHPNSSAIASSARALQSSITRRFNQLIDQCVGDQNFNGDEVEYIRSVSKNVKDECSSSIALLEKLVNTTDLTMTDDERIDRTNAVVTELNDQYEFTVEFCNSTQMLAIARKKDKNTITFLQEQL